MENTRVQLRELLEKEPYLSTASLARRVGISRQRAHQIIQKEGLKPGKWYFDPTIKLGPAPPPKSRVVPSDGCGPISHTVAGTIAEMLVAADLMARGWLVFFPLVRTTKFDLVAVSKDGETVRRIEARCAKRSGSSLVYPAKDHQAFDHLALIVAGEPVTYRPPL